MGALWRTWSAIKLFQDTHNLVLRIYNAKLPFESQIVECVIKSCPRFVNPMKNNVSIKQKWIILRENITDIYVDVTTVPKEDEVTCLRSE